jgi:hypothetical protein
MPEQDPKSRLKNAPVESVWEAGYEKAVNADASLLAGVMRLTNGIVPRRSLVRRYLALWLSSNASEHSGLCEFPPMRDESAEMLQIVLAKHITQLSIS